VRETKWRIGPGIRKIQELNLNTSPFSDEIQGREDISENLVCLLRSFAKRYTLKILENKRESTVFEAKFPITSIIIIDNNIMTYLVKTRTVKLAEIAGTK
jgi:hypothetical protein